MPAGIGGPPLQRQLRPVLPLFTIAPAGIAGFVLHRSSHKPSGEGEIRGPSIEAPGDCMVALRGRLFYSTRSRLSVVLPATGRTGRFRDRRGETLFSRRKRWGALTGCKGLTPRISPGLQQPITPEGVRRRQYEMCGFCRAPDEEITKTLVLPPGRYGRESAEDDGGPFEEKMRGLTAKPPSIPGIARLGKIRANLKGWDMSLRRRADGQTTSTSSMRA